MCLLFLSACRGAEIITSPEMKALTPYSIQTEEIQPQVTPETETDEVPLATSTPVPIIHVVALGETISSISLQYGIPMDAIIRANPQANPYILIVGDELVIPPSGGGQPTALDPTVVENVHVSDPFCTEMAGGLWCSSIVENNGQMDLVDIVVKFSLYGSDGSALEQISAPLLMRRTAKGSVNLATVFFPAISDQQLQVTVEISSAVLLDQEESGFLPVIVEGENIWMDKLEANVSGVMRVDSENGDVQVDVWIGAAAFNEQGQLVGIRRLESVVQANQAVDFSITVYSSGSEISDVQWFVEAFSSEKGK